MNTTPPSMLHKGTCCASSNLQRMAYGTRYDPESPGFRRGLFVGLSRDKKPRVETRGHRA